MDPRRGGATSRGASSPTSISRRSRAGHRERSCRSPPVVRDPAQRRDETNTRHRERDRLSPMRLQVREQRQPTLVVSTVMLTAQRHDRPRIPVTVIRQATRQQMRRICRRRAADDATPLSDRCPLLPGRDTDRTGPGRRRCGAKLRPLQLGRPSLRLAMTRRRAERRGPRPAVRRRERRRAASTQPHPHDRWHRAGHRPRPLL